MNRHTLRLMMMIFVMSASAVLWLALEVHPGAAQANDPGAVCEDVRLLMQNGGSTPYELALGGGVLASGSTQQSQLDGDTYADFWSFAVLLPRDTFNNPQDTSISIEFPAVDDSAALEVALFRGMELLSAQNSGTTGYQQLTAGLSLNYLLEQDGSYTLVVRRRQISGQGSGYSLRAGYPSAPLALTPIPDNSMGRDFGGERGLNGGIERLALPAVVLAHPGAVTGVGTQNRTQVFFGRNGAVPDVRTAGDITALTLLGGDLAVRDAAQGRLLFVQNYAYQDSLDLSTLQNFRDASGTSIAADWAQVAGVWLLNNCTGILFRDGTTFIAQTPAEGRSLRFGEPTNDLCEAYTIELNALLADASAAQHSVCMTRADLPTSGGYGEMSLTGGVFNLFLTVPYDGETGVKDPDIRQVQAQSTLFTLLRREPDATSSRPYWTLALEDDISITLDWLNLKALTLTGTPEARQLTLVFLDAPRTATTRSGVNLSRFEAFDDVIRIIYKPQGTVPGEQRLLLPASDAYLELITPAGEPAYNPAALPSEAGHFARALNNRGGDCAAVNTLLPQAQCASNGAINPANGNLWYGVTDHSAAGYLLDLALVRSYNSHDYRVDGPFGLGWTSNALLDFNLPFDSASSSRPVDWQTPYFYRTGLNLSWAPRGIVTLETFSGSRHTFASSTPAADGSDTLTAITLPGWTLYRPNLRGAWTLTQPDGLTMTFDRAGRLTSYGYPALSRVVSVTYPRTALNGPGDLAGAPVYLTDTAGTTALRRLELYYHPHGHVAFAVLRDLTGVDVPALDAALANAALDPAALDAIALDCRVQDNCFATRYSYDQRSTPEGGTVYLLSTVEPAYGAPARYAYDDLLRLIWHDDPHAPIAQTMVYDYEQDSAAVRAAFILPVGTTPDALSETLTPWRTLGASVSGSERTVTVTDYPLYGIPADGAGIQRTYRYSLAGGNLRAAEGTFTLLGESTPLSDVAGGDVMALPAQYTWQNGLLTGFNQRVIPGGGGGRNTTTLLYSRSGQFSGVDNSGFPDLGLSYTESGQISAVGFPDSTQMQFSGFDARGLPATRQDRYGAATAFTWDEQGWLQSADDGRERFEFTYNAVGLVTGVTRYGLDSPDDSGYTTSYRYDGLGRLLSVDTPELGFTFGYAYAAPDSTGAHDCDPTTGDDLPGAALTVESVDTLGVFTEQRFDARGWLLETRVTADSKGADYLRRSSYEYDVLGRVCIERHWLLEADGSETPFNTLYRYNDAVTALPALPGDSGDTVIRGFSVTRLTPDGQAQTYTYDALGRIRETQGSSGSRTRYDYSAYNGAANGLQIIQRDYVQDALSATTVYRFNTQWQLIGVQRSTPASAERPALTLEWEVFIGADNVNLRAVEADSAGVQAATYTQASSPPALPAGVTFNLTSPMTGGSTEIDPALAVTYDTFGRPAMLTQQVGGVAQTTQLVTCALANGTQQTRRSLPNQSTPFGCASADFAASVTYDAFGRLLGVQDAYGVRSIRYTPDSDLWRVTVTASSEADTLERTLWLDTLGQVRRYQDPELDLQRDYTYDTLGRLKAVDVTTLSAGEPVPEASYTFTFDSGDRLLRIEDGLERGFAYSYNRAGQVTVEQNLNTGEITTYVYDAAGRLTSVIAPNGATTRYSYDDPADSQRVTGVSTPAGGQERFIWDDQRQTLTYIDALQRETVYRWDALGQLYAVTDAAGQQTEWRYDTGGSLTSQRVLDARGTEQQNITLTYAGPQEVRISESQTPGWNWQMLLLPGGSPALVTNPAGYALRLGYDPFGRVQSIDAGGERAWALSRGGGALTLESTGFAGAAVVTLAIDPLYRLTDDGRQQVEYLTATRGSSTAQRLSFPDGSQQLRLLLPGIDNPPTLPRIVQAVPGVRVVYSYTGSGLLTSIERAVCMEAGDYALPEDPRDLEDMTDPCAMLQSAPANDPPLVWHSEERFVYNDSGQIIRAIDSEQNIQTFTYDSAGNLVTYQDKNGATFTYRYDALNRLQELVSPTGIRLLLGYNAYNGLTGICQLPLEIGTTAQSISTYEQCAAERPERVLVQYSGYDRLGRLTEQRFPGGDTLRFDYAAGGAGLLTGWTGAAGSAELVYSADALTLLAAVNGGGLDYDLSYHTLNRLAGGLDGVDYSRETSISVDGRSLTYGPADGGGYFVRDDKTGATVTYRVGANQVLTAIEYDTAAVRVQAAPFADGNALTVCAQYAGAQTTPPENCADAFDGTGTITSLSVYTNTLGDIQQQRFELNDVAAVDYIPQRDAAGQPKREFYLGFPEFFLFSGQSAGGYALVHNYDAGGRLLTTRVGLNYSGSSSALLYASTATYDSFGRLVQDSVQYADGSLADVRYSYSSDPSQLAGRRVSFTQPTSSAQAGGVLLAGAALPVGLWLLRRRRALTRRAFVRGGLALLVLVGVGTALASKALAQDNRPQRQELFFAYRYAGGNLAQVERVDANGQALETCATYSYDAANRLIRVESGGSTREYTYDVYNRVIAVNDTVLVYDGSSQTALFSDGDGTMVYGQLPGTLPLLAVGADSAAYLFANERSLLGSSDGASTAPLDLYDPAGRYIYLEPPLFNTAATGCLTLFAPPASVGLQPLADGRLLDAAAGVYLQDGRAYLPEVRQMAQRAAGVDASGGFYNAETAPPPLAAQTADAWTGLRRLQQAQQHSTYSDSLTASAVLARYAPTPIGQPAPLLGDLNMPGAALRGRLGEQISLARWLPQQYNLSGAQVQAHGGVLSLPQPNAPGQSATTAPDLLTFDPLLWGDPLWLPAGMPASGDLLDSALAARQQPMWQVRLYDGAGWWQRSPDGLAQPAVPALDSLQTPSALLPLLPRPLRLTPALFAMPQLATTLNSLPQTSGALLVEQVFNASLPAVPAELPYDGDAWAASQLRTGDTLGIDVLPAPRWQVPAPADYALPSIAVDWLYPVQTGR